MHIKRIAAALLEWSDIICTNACLLIRTLELPPDRAARSEQHVLRRRQPERDLAISELATLSGQLSLTSEATERVGNRHGWPRDRCRQLLTAASSFMYLKTTTSNTPRKQRTKSRRRKNAQ